MGLWVSMTHISSRPPEGHSHGEADPLYRWMDSSRVLLRNNYLKPGSRDLGEVIAFDYDLMGLVLHHRKMAF